MESMSKRTRKTAVELSEVRYSTSLAACRCFVLLLQEIETVGPAQMLAAVGINPTQDGGGNSADDTSRGL